MTRNVRRNLQLRLKVARNAKQKHQQPSKVEINAKQFVQRLSKWQETQNNAHFFLLVRYCLAFLSILGLKRRNCLAFPATIGIKISPQLPHSCHTVTPQLTFLCALPQQVPYKHPTSNPTSLPYKLTGKKS